MKITSNFIRKIPKTDLHLHLDGSIRINTLIELAKENKITLPAYSETELRQKVFKDKYKDLQEYLHSDRWLNKVPQKYGYKPEIVSVLDMGPILYKNTVVEGEGSWLSEPKGES